MLLLDDMELRTKVGIIGDECHHYARQLEVPFSHTFCVAKI